MVNNSIGFQKYYGKIPRNIKFGQITAPPKQMQMPAVTYQTIKPQTAQPNQKQIETEYGTNIYDVLNTVFPAFGNLTNTIKTIAGTQPASESGQVANTSKTSAQVLNSVNNADTYNKLSAAKTELEVGKNILTAGYNESSDSYIDEKSKAALSELGIEVPNLGQISGKYEDYEKDMDTFEEGLNKCQQVQDESNAKLPEISEKKSVAQSRVSSLRASKINLMAQIIAAKLAKQDTSALEQQLAEVKRELQEAKKELKKWRRLENGLKSAIAESEKKKLEIEKNKEDLTNYHEAEGKVKDKTFDIAKLDDKKIKEATDKLEKKQKEIEKAAKDSNKNTTDASDNTRNQNLERLQQEYSKLAMEASDIFVDLDHLVKDNDNELTVENSHNQKYDIKNYNRAKEILSQGN